MAQQIDRARKWQHPYSKLQQEAYDAGDAAGYKRGLEDALKQAEEASIEYYDYSDLIRRLRALAEGKEG